jgi:hypothetical protein
MLAVALLIEFDAYWPVSLLLMGYALVAWIALWSLPSQDAPAIPSGMSRLTPGVVNESHD